MKKITMLMIATLLATVCFAGDYPVRTWTRKSGTTIEGSYVETFIHTKSGKETVRIQTTAGKKMGVVVKMLSDEDVAYIQSVSK